MDSSKIKVKNFNDENTQKFIWRKEWFNDYISPWVVFERFMYANSASTRDILSLFGTEKAQLKPRLNEHQDFITLKAFDNEKVNNSLGIDLYRLSNEFVRRFIMPLNQGEYTELLVRKTLAFCPDCLKLGYHSYLHQYSLLENCPFHGTKLITKCPNCKEEIPLKINLRRDAFHCACGAPLIDDMPGYFFAIWSKSNSLGIQNEEILNWFSLTVDDLAQITNKLYIVPETCIKFGQRTLGVLFEIHKNNNGVVVESNNNVLKQYFPLLPNMQYFRKAYISYVGRYDKEDVPELFNNFVLRHYSYYRYINMWLKPIYKSIIRHIKKRILVNHKRCIRSVKKDSIKVRLRTINIVRSICPYAKAYIKWRKELERFPDDWMVDSFDVRLKPADIKIDKLYYEPMFESMQLYAVIGSNAARTAYAVNWGRSMWILSHLYGHFIIRRFDFWLNVMKRNGKYKWNPFFVLEFRESDSKGKSIRFHSL